MKKKRSRNSIMRSEIRKMLHAEFGSALHDVDYRIKVLRDMSNGSGRLGSADLNLASHQIDGYTVTDDSPTAGSIAWADLHIVYKGVDYPITSGNSANKYNYWLLSAPTVLTKNDTKPTLTEDDVLVFVNESGKHITAMSSGKLVSGATLTGLSVSSAELGAGSVIEAKLAALAVTSGKLASGSVIDGKLGSDSINAANIKAGVVAAAKLNTAQHMVY